MRAWILSLGLLVVAVGVSLWSPASAQSTRTAPAVREVNSDGIYTNTLNASDGIGNIADQLSEDATHDEAAQSTGPQGMGECDDTATDGVDEGDAGKVRVDCTTRALYTRVIDPCTAEAKTFYVLNASTAATVEIANAVASEFFYICGVNLVAGAAQTIAIAEDDTDGCGSLTAGLHGGATAATGWSFAANGGIALGNGTGTVMKTATAARYLCVITGQAAQISGTISYVSAP